MARCNARNKHSHDWKGRQALLCQRWVKEQGQRCYLHGGASTGPRSPPAIGYSEARRKCAQADIQRCKSLGIKRRGGRRAGPLWATEGMVERAMVIARELGVWGLPERDGKLVWWLLKAGRDPDARPKARELLLEAERRVAKQFLNDMLSQNYSI